MKTYKSLIFGICCYGLLLASVGAQSTDDVFWDNLEKMRFDNPDSAIIVLNSYYNDFIDKKDTINAIKSLNRLATVYGN
ncbi:MAG: hypothetical protein AAF806_08070, partial [Bacteroidota bacterium]